jgi:hypothetical protein
MSPKAKPVQERLPGTGAPDRAIERQKRVVAAIEELHDALLETLEGMPSGDGWGGGIDFGKKIKGDHVQVRITLGKG